MESNLRVILQQLEAEKSVNRETLLEAIRSAIESAARKSMTHAAEVTVVFDAAGSRVAPRDFFIVDRKIDEVPC